MGISLEPASTSETLDRLARWQIWAAALLAIAIAGGIAHDVLESPDVPFLAAGDAPWIVAQTPLQTHGMEIDRAHPPVSFFERRFSGDGRGERVTLRVRALREVALFLNGQPLPIESNPERWKRGAVLDVTSRITPGENLLVARVTNPTGNPALQLRVDGLAQPLVSDTSWPSAWEGDPVAYAALAEDSIRHPERLDLPAAPESLRSRALPLALFAALGVLLFLVLRGPRFDAAWAPALALTLVSAYWVLLFRQVVRTPAEVGFDAAGHVQYIEWIHAHRALPPPAEGAATYHPPLFYVLAALLLGVLQPLGIGTRSILALLPLAAGYGMVWVARAMARCLVPRAPWIEAATILAAGFLPMNLTLAGCVSNEAPYALVASLALLVTLRASVRERATLRDDVMLGVVLGAGALTKYSILLWVPLLPGVLGLKRLVVERASARRAVSGAALAIGLVIALAGWVYLRNLQLTGNPVVTNHDAVPGKTWWQLPGFHTATYFGTFGDAIVAPWFSSFHSFWDSLYSTLWGDGLLSGAVSPRLAVRRWDYPWMAVAFVLAIPATLLLGVGWLDVARRSLRGSDWGARIGFSVLFTAPVLLFVSILSVNLRYPYWSLGKSFYALSLTPSLGLLFSLGLARLDAVLERAPLAIRALPAGWAGAFLAAIACSYVT